MPSLRSLRSSPSDSRPRVAVFEPSRSNAWRAAARAGAVSSLTRWIRTSWRSIQVAPPGSPRPITPRASSTPNACCANPGSRLIRRTMCSAGRGRAPPAASSAHSRSAERSLPVALHASCSHADSSSAAPPSLASPAALEIRRSRIASAGDLQIGRQHRPAAADALDHRVGERGVGGDARVREHPIEDLARRGGGEPRELVAGRRREQRAGALLQRAEHVHPLARAHEQEPRAAGRPADHAREQVRQLARSRDRRRTAGRRRRRRTRTAGRRRRWPPRAPRTSTGTLARRSAGCRTPTARRRSSRPAGRGPRTRARRCRDRAGAGSARRGPARSCRRRARRTAGLRGTRRR